MVLASCIKKLWYNYSIKKLQNNLANNGASALYAIVETSRMMNIECFPFFGTLLGVYRECNLISHDTDLDVTMEVNYLSRELLDNLKNSGFLLDHLGFASDFRGCILSMLYKGIVTEIYFYYTDNGQQYTYLPCEGNHSWREYSTINMYPVKEVVTPEVTSMSFHNFRDSQIMIPDNTGQIMQSLYGSDYMIPNKGKKGGCMVKESIPFVKKRWHVLPMDLVDDEILTAISKCSYK